MGKLEYLGLSKGNLAWIKWRDGMIAETEEHGKAAIQHWKDLAAAFPFQWTARLPLAATWLADGKIRAALEVAKPVIEASQHRLPDAIAEPLKRGFTALDDGKEEQAGACLEEALRAAKDRGYL